MSATFPETGTPFLDGSLPAETVDAELMHVTLETACSDNATETEQTSPVDDQMSKPEPLPTSVSDTSVAAANGDFICRYCSRPFDSQTALGGHISKGHPGRSEVYQQKMQSCQKNEPKRRARRVAKLLFSEACAASGAEHSARDMTQLIKILTGHCMPLVDRALPHEKAKVNRDAVARLHRHLHER